jgi:hypothetical protein
VANEGWKSRNVARVDITPLRTLKLSPEDLPSDFAMIHELNNDFISFAV